MLIRRRERVSTEGLLLDANDTFLLGLFSGTEEIHLLELVELVPGDPIEVMRRLHMLAGLGLIELRDELGTEYEVAAPRAESLIFSSIPAAAPVLLSLRPTLSPHTAVTARPPQPLPIAELFRNAQSDFDKLRTTFTGPEADRIARSLSRESLKTTLVQETSEGRAARRENLKATLVDDASDERASELKRVC